MFDNFSDKLDKALHVLKGHGKITEVNVAETLKAKDAVKDLKDEIKIANTVMSGKGGFKSLTKEISSLRTEILKVQKDIASMNDKQVELNKTQSKQAKSIKKLASEYKKLNKVTQKLFTVIGFRNSKVENSLIMKPKDTTGLNRELELVEVQVDKRELTRAYNYAHFNKMQKNLQIGHSELVNENYLAGGTTFFRGPHLMASIILARRFADNGVGFLKRAQLLGGQPAPYGEFGVEFEICPGLNWTIALWERDSEFPARTQYLFDRKLDQIFQLDVIWALGNLIAAKF